MNIISQRFPKWSKIKLGQSASTIGECGCLITSLSMLTSWYRPYYDPIYMANNLKFTKDGLLLWTSIDKANLPFKFVYRYYSEDKNKILEILNSKNGSCVLQVNNKKHWVVLVGYSRLYGYKIADPYYGDIIYLKKRYPNVTGFAELTRK